MAVRAISETLRTPCAKHSFRISLYSSVVRRKLIILLLDSIDMDTRVKGAIQGAGDKARLTSKELRSTTDSRPAPKSVEVPLSSGGAESRPVLAFEELRTTGPESSARPKSERVPWLNAGAQPGLAR